MNMTNIISGVLTAGVLFSGALSAQQQGDPAATLNAIVQAKSAKGLTPVRLVNPEIIDKGKLRLIPLGQNADPTPRDMTSKELKVLAIMAPPELVEARRLYSEGNLNAAKRKLAETRVKYTNFVGLPDSPSVQAARTELRCLARLRDWAGLAKAVEEFPYPKLQESTDRAMLNAARLLSHVSDDPATAADRRKDIEAQLADTNRIKRLHSTEYGWLKYALGRALASGIPTDSVPEDKVSQASQAVDAYCEAAVCYRGGEMEIATDALVRAFHLLWAMPGVKHYGNTVKKMDAKKWNEAPADFRDAVAMANMLTTILAPELKDAAVQQAAGYFVNTQEGKRPATAGNAPADAKG